MTNNDQPRRPRPTFTELIDWVEGRVTRESAAEMASYDDLGDEERATIDWIKEFRQFAAENPVPTPPPIVKQRLQQAFQRYHGTLPALARHAAHLMFDSRDDVVMAGVRGHADVEEGYQRTFAAESYGVLIDVLPVSPAEVRIEGQVLGMGFEPSVWEIRAEYCGGSVTDINGDENGSFAVSNVPSAVRSLHLSNGQVTIEIRDPLGELE